MFTATNPTSADPGRGPVSLPRRAAAGDPIVNAFLEEIARAIAEKNRLAELAGALAQSTGLRYVQTYNRALNTGIVDLGNQSTARLLRAAFEHVFEQRLLSVEDYDDLRLVAAHRTLASFRSALKATPHSDSCPRDSIGQLGRYLESRGIRAYGVDQSEIRPRVPRTRRLQALPEDWRELMLEALSTRIPNAREALIVLGLLGCRPEELKTARVRKLTESTIEITVSSVKGLGGPEPVRRGAVFAPSGPALAAEYLSDHNAPDGHDPFAHLSAKCLDNLLRRTSQAAFPKLSPSISAYCYRNALSSDLKRAGFSRRDIAMLLGHTTTRQQKSYGRSRYGRAGSGWLPSRVVMSHEVRSFPAPYCSKDIPEEVDYLNEDDAHGE